MRNRVWITCAIILAVCLFLIILNRKQHQNIISPTQDTTVTSQPSKEEMPKPGNTQQNPNTSRVVSLPPSTTPIVKALAVTNPIAAARLALWQAPIEFYGKVVDENSNAVAGANVVFNWTETPSEDGNRTSATSSDAQGLFSLHGARGPSLVVSVGKDGYYSSHNGQKGFKYAFGDITAPDPQNPVVFQLKRKGTPQPLITTHFPIGIGQIAQLHHDGTPIEIDLLTGNQVPIGNGQLKLELWRDISDINAQHFNWKIQLSVPNGGLVETDEEFDFQAPQSGYQPSIVIDMPATNQNWQGEVNSKYYIQLANGDYGRIDFYLLAYNGAFTVHSAVNPTGSQNLEPAQ